ncbi:hypothetical protein OB2597_04740 [Pseudooceanicola batsensis HTCC2597]|uniref:Uncharacterized protein n=1 Tax=Pseudooceanicola batsensis (strain ATCC BAA-863 / DSM 15984 / KCTC 12145 / HTCC2597) TaxID=252305 RepID=A3TSD3_PSEBH|nr:hypothetical protein [Pseudooceanicola batsensis]EAQ04560.1 hypothetical protein OB2597_04740 [Pseudooceanicola batsensis HTCC2597]
MIELLVLITIATIGVIYTSSTGEAESKAMAEKTAKDALNDAEGQSGIGILGIDVVARKMRRMVGLAEDAVGADTLASFRGSAEDLDAPEPLQSRRDRDAGDTFAEDDREVTPVSADTADAFVWATDEDEPEAEGPHDDEELQGDADLMSEDDQRDQELVMGILAEIDMADDENLHGEAADDIEDSFVDADGGADVGLADDAAREEEWEEDWDDVRAALATDTLTEEPAAETSAPTTAPTTAPAPAVETPAAAAGLDTRDAPTVEDFDPEQDQLLIAYRPGEAGNGRIGIAEDPLRPGSAAVTLGGRCVAVVLGGFGTVRAHHIELVCEDEVDLAA